MPVKFGPEGYSSERVRRFQQSDSAEIDPGAPEIMPRGRGAHPLGLLLAVGVILFALFYVGRAAHQKRDITTTGRVVSKSSPESQDGTTRFSVSLSLALPEGGQQEVTIVCDEQLWKACNVGDTIAANCTQSGRGAPLVVIQLVPNPAPADL